MYLGTSTGVQIGADGLVEDIFQVTALHASANTEFMPLEVGPLIETGRVKRLENSPHLEFELALDVSRLGFFDKKWIVSRKRGRNLGDLINTWKKAVLRARGVDDDVDITMVDDWEH